jgi:hypothetical protein
VSGIPIPEQDWLALNIRLDELSKGQKDLHGQIVSLKSQLEPAPMEATVIEETTIEEEEAYDGPSNVFFISASCNFTGEWPVLYWEKLEDADMKYEIRLDANFGNATNLIVVTSADNYTVKQWKVADGRTDIFYIKALDTQGRYSRDYDTITLTNVAPTMSSFSPTVSISKVSRTALVSWSAWTGFTATDLDGFKVYRSTEAVCTISDDNLVDKAAKTKKSMSVGHLSKGITYDFRVVPCDVFGDGSASD